MNRADRQAIATLAWRAGEHIITHAKHILAALDDLAQNNEAGK